MIVSLTHQSSQNIIGYVPGIVAEGISRGVAEDHCRGIDPAKVVAM